MKKPRNSTKNAIATSTYAAIGCVVYLFTPPQSADKPFFGVRVAAEQDGRFVKYSPLYHCKTEAEGKALATQIAKRPRHPGRGPRRPRAPRHPPAGAGPGRQRRADALLIPGRSETPPPRRGFFYARSLRSSRRAEEPPPWPSPVPPPAAKPHAARPAHPRPRDHGLDLASAPRKPRHPQSRMRRHQNRVPTPNHYTPHPKHENAPNRRHASIPHDLPQTGGRGTRRGRAPMTGLHRDAHRIMAPLCNAVRPFPRRLT